MAFFGDATRNFPSIFLGPENLFGFLFSSLAQTVAFLRLLFVRAQTPRNSDSGKGKTKTGFRFQPFS